MFNFELPVPLAQYIVSQAIGVFLLVSIIIAFQAKNPKKTLFVLFIANILGFTAALLLLNYAVAALAAVTAVKNLVFFFMVGKKISFAKSFSILMLINFANVLAVSLVWIFLTPIAWVMVFDALLLVTQIFTNYASWKAHPHLIRIGATFYGVFILGNSVLFFNLFGIIVAIFQLSSITVFYIRLSMKKKGARIEGEEKETHEINLRRT